MFSAEEAQVCWAKSLIYRRLYNLKRFWRGFFAKKEGYIGIDVGAAHIKTTAVRISEGRPSIAALHATPTPPGVFAGEFDGEALAGALRQVAAECGLEGREVVSSVWGDKVITRHVSIPFMPDKELEKAVRWEAEKFIPVPVSDMIIRHVKLGEVEEAGVKQVHLLLAAVSTDLVYQYHAAFEQANLKLTALDLQSFALWRVFNGESGLFSPAYDAESLAENEAYAVVDIGKQKTHFVIIRDAKFKYTRTFPVGISLQTGAPAGTGEKDIYTASRDVPAAVVHEAASAGARDANVPHGAGAAALFNDEFRSGLGELTRELQRSLDFYKTRDRGFPARRLIITGGGAKLQGLAQFLTGELGIPVQVGIVKCALEASGDVSPPPTQPGAKNDEPAQPGETGQSGESGEPGKPGSHTAGIDPAFAVSLGLALREIID